MAGTESWWEPKWTLCYGHPLRLSEIERFKLEDIDMDDIIYASDISEKMTKPLRIRDLIDYIKQNKG